MTTMIVCQAKPSLQCYLLQQSLKQYYPQNLIFQNMNHNNHNIIQHTPVINLSTHLHNPHTCATTVTHFT